MNKRKRLFSKRKIVVLSVILLVAVVTTGLVRPVRKIAKIAYIGAYLVVIVPIQESLQHRHLLCSTDHQALLEECRRLSAQIVGQDPNIRGEYDGREVRDSELSDFPTIKKVGGIVLVHGNGGATIKMGDTFRHFGVHALSKDYEEHHPNATCGNCELVRGLWYYDDRYNRDKNYHKVVERLLRKNKTRKKTGAD